MKIKSIGNYLLLWSTQALSAFGSGMTSYALVLWLYLNTGSALKTSMLSVCSYAPYVMMSIFAGALSDRWRKKHIMLVCDLIAALSTVAVLLLIKSGLIAAWHLYVINAVNGLMNTVQQPAGEVAATLLVPEEYYQKTSGLRSFSGSLNSILTPVIATAIFAFAGMEAVIAVDLMTFAVAFATLGLFIHIPEQDMEQEAKESVISAARAGLRWLRDNPLITQLMLFLACVNLTASMYDAALPAMVLSRENGGEAVLGAVNACSGLAVLFGSVIVTVIPSVNNRIKIICITLFISLGTENLILAFCHTPVMWCIGAILGWLPIPLMNANMDVIFRKAIPKEMQGRVYSCRNTLQFFTIPLGLLTGGALVDKVFEPYMANTSSSLLTALFGTGKGSGASMLFFVIGIAGTAVCVIFTLILRKYKWNG